MGLGALSGARTPSVDNFWLGITNNERKKSSPGRTSKTLKSKCLFGGAWWSVGQLRGQGLEDNEVFGAPFYCLVVCRPIIRMKLRDSQFLDVFLAHVGFGASEGEDLNGVSL